MSKQTAVNWLIDKIYFKYVIVNRKLLDQAIEMEKQQIIDFADDYVDNCVIPNENMAIPTLMDVPQYYNKNFNK